jgi:hypothetical protein
MARPQGAQASAKEDTRYLALGGALATDLSQYLTNLAVAGAGAYEAPSPRSVLALERTVSVRWRATAAEASVVLMVCGNAAQTDIVWGLATDGAGRVCGYIDGSIGVITSTAPVAAEDYTISWGQRANPDTTGPGDAVISELAIYSHTAGAWVDVIQATHSIPTTGSGPYDLSVAGWWDGAALQLSPANAPTIARVSSQHHPHTEAAEDWIAPRPAYSGDAGDGPAETVGPIPASAELGDESEIAGRHPWGYAAAHAQATRTRAWSSLVNEATVDGDGMPEAVAPAWTRSIPGAAAASMSIAWLRWLSLPREATHAWTRIHVRQWVLAGAPVTIRYYALAMSRPPGLASIGLAPAPPLATALVSGDLTLDDELGPGVWIELGYLALPRISAEITGWRDTVHVCLGWQIDPGGGAPNAADARFIIDAWHMRPAIRSVPWTQREL